MLDTYRSLTASERRNLKLAICVLVLFFLFCHFLFTGERVKGVQQIHSGCTVTVLHQTDIEDAGTLYTLNEEQVTLLRQELFDGLYLRSLSNIVYGKTAVLDRYFITVSWPDAARPDLSLELFGGRWLQTEQFGGDFMKVMTPDLFDRLDAILNI